MKSLLMFVAAVALVFALPYVGEPAANPLDKMIPQGEPTMDGMVLCENGPVRKSVYDPDSSDNYIVVIRSQEGFTMAVVRFPNGPADVAVGDKVSHYDTMEALIAAYPRICNIPILGGGPRT